MEQAILVPVGEYLRTSYDPDVDYVDGVLEERNVGELDHSDLQSEIVYWVRTNYRRSGLNAFAELRVAIGSTRFRVPDVVITRGKRPKSGILTSAPLVAIEVLSPEDRLSRVQARIDDYLRIGTQQVWVIDPITRRAWAHTATSITEVRDGVLRIADAGFTLPLAELYAAIDDATEA